MLENLLPVHLLSRVRQAIGPLVQIGLVYLEDIASENNLGAFSGAGDYRLDFQRSKVLCFVDDEESVAQAAATDIGQGFDYQFLIP